MAESLEMMKTTNGGARPVLRYPHGYTHKPYHPDKLQVLKHQTSEVYSKLWTKDANYTIKMFPSSAARISMVVFDGFCALSERQGCMYQKPITQYCMCISWTGIVIFANIKCKF